MRFVPEVQEKNWYAVYTVVRHEKSAGSALVEKGVEIFLPLRRVTSRWKDRWKRIQVPLFPGYLFVLISHRSQEMLNVLRTRGVVSILGAGQIPGPVPEEQIVALKVLVQSGLKYDAEELYERGKDVIVVNGPLSGIRGKFIERRGAFRLILEVEMIHRAVAVQVDLRDVELL